jgi:hypothetical protein
MFPFEAVGQDAPNLQFVPGLQDCPLLYRKDQARITLSGAATAALDDLGPGPLFGAELRGAYALTDRIGLVGGGYLYHLDRTEVGYTFGGAFPVTTEYRYQGDWRFAEVGAGTFRLFSGNWIGEVYGLVGMGATRNEFPDGYWMSSDMVSLAVQPIIGRASGYLEYAFSSRFRYFDLLGFRSADQPTNYMSDFDWTLVQQGPFLIWEPSLMIRGGWQRTRVTFQVGYCGDVLGTGPMIQADLTLGLGLCLWLPGKRTQEAPEP